MIIKLRAEKNVLPLIKEVVNETVEEIRNQLPGTPVIDSQDGKFVFGHSKLSNGMITGTFSFMADICPCLVVTRN